MPEAERPAEQRAWLATAVALDGYRRAYGLDEQPPAKHVGGERLRAGPDGLAGTADRAGWRHPARERPGRRPERSTLERERVARVAELLGAEPGRCEAGRRRDWQQVQAALERLERERSRDPDRHHDRADDRHRPVGREHVAHGRDER